MSTALYRRYRPETFADVIGQEHVTGPLMAALDNGRVTHAYLFSGPRGCGKTTSARIFARCLNCANGPTSTPCGTCDSCVELARGGAGSIDVVEMDAASHGGVDDARELRERAAFAPARDRFKVFIIDEAHMVSTQGFNALLKLVEEPPPHVKFVFATTEPEKVIGTIRSRTHHYPFRLVPPEQLTEYLSSLAEAEGVQVDSGVLPLVVRAGGGSVRDSLSVLDQLIAGTNDGTVDYERAVALLGFTHGALLDDTVDALAARDGASLFSVVDRVIESGHAPRRFVEDLLERLRDLIVVRAAGEQAGSVLRAVPADQLERMATQASHLPSAALSRAADLVNEALTEMAGATSPRLQLELLCARLLLPSADDGAGGFAARLEWLEGAVASGQAGSRSGGAAVPPAEVASMRPVAAPPVSAAPAPAAPVGPADPAPPAERAESAERAGSAESVESAEPAERAGSGEPSAAGSAPVADQAIARGVPADPGSPAVPASGPAAGSGSAASSEPPAASGAAPGGGGAGLSAAEVRRRWPEVLDTLARIKRTTWALISQDAQIVDLDATTLQLGFSTSGLASAFRNGQHADFLQRALVETLGLDVRIEPIVADGSAGGGLGGPGPGGGPGSGGSSGGSGRGPGSRPGGSSGGAATSGWDTPEGGATPTPSDDGSGLQPGATSAPAPGVAQVPDDSGAPTAAAGGRDAPPPWDVPEESAAGPATPAAGSAEPTTSSSASAASPDDSVSAADPASAAAPVASPEDPATAPSAAAGTAEPAPEGSPSTADDPGAADPNDWPPMPPTWAERQDPVTPEADAGAAQSGAAGPPAASSAASVSSAAPTSPEAPTSPAGPPRSGTSRDQGEAPPSSTAAPAASPREQAMAAAREARRASLSHGASATPEAAPPPEPDFDPDPNDPDIESTGLTGAPLVARLLGGTVIDEILESSDGGDR